MNKFSNRYDRQQRLESVGAEGQSKLRDARVLVAGMGGLGSPAAQYLAGAGIGLLGILDHDKVEVTNLHRQPLFGEEDLGKFKVDVAARKLNLINSEVRIVTHRVALRPENAVDIVMDYDLVLDGTDNFETKYLINDACLLAGKPWVYASVYKYQGQLSVFNYQGGPTYRCLFPQPPDYHSSCEETGVLGVVPGLLGIWQAAEALKMILGTGGVLSGSLKVIDVRSGRAQDWEIARNEEQVNRIGINGVEAVYTGCKLRETEKLYLDVRDSYEQPRPEGDNILFIPLKDLEDRYPEIPRDREILVFCQSGSRSRSAIRLLEELGFSNVKNVEGGIKHIAHGEENPKEGIRTGPDSPG